MIDLRTLDRFRNPRVEAFMSMDQPVPLSQFGAFDIGFATHEIAMRVIASAGGGWDHVSASFPDRTPTWEEMDRVYKLFFKPQETAMQLHVPDTDHVNHHAFCLHLWRPFSGLKAIPRPPSWMVGPDRDKGRKAG